MCDCWLIERAATPIASTGGALSMCGITSSGSTVTDHGQRFGSIVRGSEIPLGARIVAVCDAFDAMIANRPYRSGMEANLALEELERCAGTQFDPDVVDAFAAAWHERAALEQVAAS